MLRQLKRSFRAISPVLAVLMMIAVAIAGGLVVFAWVMGYIGFSTGTMEQAIEVHNIANYQSDTDLLVYVQNVGEGAVQLEESECLYVNGRLELCAISGVTVSDGVATLGEGETAKLTVAGGAALPGEEIAVKVTAVSGVYAEKVAYPAGYERVDPVFDHFVFAAVESPQTSGVPFNLTVRAVDQYADLYVNYSGGNSLVYSGWAMSPSATGNFVNGAWTGEVTVIGSATGATITTISQSNSLWTGTSNKFNVSGVADMLWNKTYGGDENQVAYSLAKTSDGGYALAGTTGIFPNLDFWLVKTDASGNMLWNRTYGGPEAERAYSVVVTSDGGFAIAGPTGINVHDYDAVWLVKTDASGNMLWNKTYVGLAAYVEGASPLVMTSDGGYALAGFTESVTLDHNFCLLKTDDLGNVEWNNTYGGSNHDEAFSLVETSDGGYALVGRTESFGAGSEDFWLVKTNATGYMEWNKTYGGIHQEFAYSVVEVSGGYAIAGKTTSFNATGEDFWLVKTDAYGNVEWNQTYGGYGNQVAYSLITTSDGGYALTGYTTTGGCYLVKTNSSGNMEWNRTYGGLAFPLPISIDYAYGLVETDDGGYAIGGTTSADFWLIKTDKYDITS